MPEPLLLNSVADGLATWGPGAVLLASVAGSGHCVAMCGGLTFALAPTRAAQLRYHLGRGLAYAGLGAAAGYLGENLLSPSTHHALTLAAAALLGIALIYAGAQLWRGKGAYLPTLPQPLLRRLHRAARGHAFCGGALTALLPCGWLHSFVLAASATQSALSGALLLAVFWMGSLPALTGANWIFTTALGPWLRKLPRVSAVFLIAAGVLSVGLKIAKSPTVTSSVSINQVEAPAQCH